MERTQRANMTISCPDRQGIVHAVTAFLLERKLNVSHLEEHIEGGGFFMRIEWEYGAASSLTADDFEAAFAPVQQAFAMHVQTDFGHIKRLGLFCSREAHCLMDILGRHTIGELPVAIPYVLSNAEDCREIVERFGIPFYVVPTEPHSFAHEDECLKIIADHPTDMIGLARYMKILSAEFIAQAKQPIINVHHSFLPSFIGNKPYEQAFERGVKLIGATSHYVTPDLDEGPIIDQQVQRVRHNYDITQLKLTGRQCEKEVFATALRKHIENKIVVHQNRTIIFE